MEVYIVQSKANLIVSSIMMVIIGIFFIVDKDLALDIGFIVAGISLIIVGLVPMIQAKDMNLFCVLLIVLGLFLILIPSFFSDVAKIVLGVVAILVGGLMTLNSFKAEEKNPKIIGHLVGILIIVAGVSILLDMDIAFQLFGGVMLVAGILNLMTLYSMR